jgi:hypothetical protein
MGDTAGLGTEPEGVGFPAAPGLLHCGAACDARGIAGYILRVPASRLYFGVPLAGLPAGFQADPLIPDAANDCHLELFDVQAVLEAVLP